MLDLKSRRPLKSRETKWASQITQYLASHSVSPNQISQVGMLSGVIAGIFFASTTLTSNPIIVGILLILGIAGCQFRLLCNLFDGMVAVEAGKKSADGPFWNEFPDRISDICVFVGVGFGTGHLALGWAAAAIAVLTAYIRELGASIGLAHDFSGPMAKQHRMALLSVTAFIAVFETIWLSKGSVLTITLWLVILGGAITAIRRSVKIRSTLLSGRV